MKNCYPFGTVGFGRIRKFVIQICWTIDGQAVDIACGGIEEGQVNGSASDKYSIVPRADRKTKVVHARFSAMEMVKIENAAQAAELTVSAFMRSLTLEGAGVRPFFTKEDRVILSALLADLRAVGINLNQLARALNQKKPRTDEERAVIDDVQRFMAALLYEIAFFADRGARLRKRGT